MKSNTSYLNKVKVTTTLDPTIVRSIDTYVKKVKKGSRSKLIENILRQWYIEQKRQEIEKGIEEYYLSLSKDEKKEDEEWIKIAAESTPQFWE